MTYVGKNVTLEDSKGSCFSKILKNVGLHFIKYDSPHLSLQVYIEGFLLIKCKGVLFALYAWIFVSVYDRK